jgi:PilZ domain
MMKRAFSRTNVNIDITIDAQDKIVQGLMENISMGGLYATIDRRSAIKEREVVDISIPLPVGARKNSFIVTGLATRVNDTGVAFRFLETDMETLRTLYHLVSLSSSNNSDSDSPPQEAHGASPLR